MTMLYSSRRTRRACAFGICFFYAVASAAEPDASLSELVDLEFADYVLMPLAFVTEFRLITWPLLGGAVLWLYYQHFLRPSVAQKTTFVVWRVLVTGAVAAGACVALLAIISPRGPDYYRVVLGAIMAIPLVLPSLLCFSIRPRGPKAGR